MKSLEKNLSSSGDGSRRWRITRLSRGNSEMAVKCFNRRTSWKKYQPSDISIASLLSQVDLPLITQLKNMLSPTACPALCLSNLPPWWRMQVSNFWVSCTCPFESMAHNKIILDRSEFNKTYKTTDGLKGCMKS